MKLVSRIGFHTVTVSKTQTTYSGWTGVEYIIVDPTKGAGTYMISGGLMGAGTACPLPKPGAYDPPGQMCPATVPLTSLFAVGSNGQWQLVSVARDNIVNCAALMGGTAYGIGCQYGTDCRNDVSSKCKPDEECVDCSGLVAYCYAESGFDQFMIIALTPIGGNGVVRFKNYINSCGGIFTFYSALAREGDLYFFTAVKNGYYVGKLIHIGIAVGFHTNLVIDAYGKPINMVDIRSVPVVVATYDSFGDFLDYSFSCPNIQ